MSMPSRKSPTLLVMVAAALVCSPTTVQANEQPPSYPKDFQLNNALNFYSIESTSLLKRSMLSAGFSVDETIEINESYLDFASRALSAEKERIEKIRDALKDNQKANTCSAGDGECSEVDDAAAMKRKDDKLDPEFGHFLTPNLKPGQADILRWEDDGSIVQDYAARVGLPPNLVPTLKDYAREMGLLDIMTNMLYDDPLPPDGVRWFSFQSPYQKGAADQRNFTWNVERPAKNWKSDMHWFNTADELSHEDSLRALAKGGFDEVLKGIGEKFGLDSLHVDSFGFVAVTNCDRGFIHTDWEDVEGKAFNFLLGIASPEDAGPELVVENERKGEVYYGSNAGVLVGDGTRHGTRECDHRAKRGVRITCSIYLADPTRDNLDILAGDTTSVFPPTGDGPGKEWVWSHRGRHWRKDGGHGLVDDLGRRPFEFDDEEDGCTKDDCTNDTERGRNGCLKTCNVFMDDSVYKPGNERREVLGY
ncbi:hypothetical protein ACHAXR_011563 [Thalassiosira sp. AJA248-18]